MTAPPPATTTRQSTLADRIAQAIGDPGSIVGRKLGPSWGRGNTGYAETEETVPRWATRAVLAVLSETPDLLRVPTTPRQLAEVRIGTPALEAAR